MPRRIYVTFHGVGKAPAWIPESEKPYWLGVDEFEAVAASMAGASSDSKLEFVATFDDGNRSDLDIAAPILRRLGLAGIFFPCTGRIGREGYLNEDDIRALEAQGFEIGSHGINHVSWRSIDDATRWREVSESKSALESVLGHPIRSVAIPFGDYDKKVVGSLKRANYEVVYCSEPGASGESAWMRRRWSCRNDVPFDVELVVKKSGSLQYNAMFATKSFLKSMR